MPLFGQTSKSTTAPVKPVEFDLPTFKQGFRRSEKGNLWRLWPIGDRTITLSVFKRGDGFAFCIAGAGRLLGNMRDPYYSLANYSTENDATEGLAYMVEDLIEEARRQEAA